MSIFSQPQFHDEAKAFDFVEAILWPTGPICPHCGGFERISAITPNKAKKVRIGLKFCGQCRKQFTVRVGTIFEDSHLPMTKWLQAIFLMCSSKKGVSSHQIMRTLDTTYKTAWFLTHRIREAMRSGDLTPFGSGGGIVEADETYFARDPDYPVFHGLGNKLAILSLVDRTSGSKRSVVIDNVTSKSVTAVLRENLAAEARLVTDSAAVYLRVGKTVASHRSVNHKAEEWVSKLNPEVHTNTIEGAFSIFKRGMKGVYQHCAKKHLHRYVAEFDFRYSNRIALGVDDQERATRALTGVAGKRLTYRSTGSGRTGASAGA